MTTCEALDAAIRKAVSIDPDARYEALPEFVIDLSQPNEAFARRRFTPLVERNPLLFWNVLSALLFLVVIWLLATR